MVHEDMFSRPQLGEAQLKAIASEGVKYRLTLLVLALADFIGLILHNVIPYTPAFPLVLLAASLICLTVALRAGRLASQLGPSERNVLRGFAYTATMATVPILIFAAIGASFGPGKSGSEASWGNPALLFNLSWPAVVICLVSIVYGIRLNRRLRG